MPPSATLSVRQVRLRARLKGFRTRTLVLVTTLVDPVAYPAEALAELYSQRWGVELHFRELKTLMRLDVLRCRSPQLIRKELLMHWIAYNLVRAVMLQAALCYHVALTLLSQLRGSALRKWLKIKVGPSKVSTTARHLRAGPVARWR